MTASIAMTIETESRITERHSSAQCGQMDDLIHFPYGFVHALPQCK